MTAANRNELGEQLSAYLDGELGEAERVAVEARLRDDAVARAELERLRGTANLVGELPHRPAPSNLADEVSARIEREQLIGPGPGGAGTRSGTPGWFRPLLLAAAVVALAITVGLLDFGPRQGDTPIGPLARSNREASPEVPESLPFEQSTSEADGLQTASREAGERQRGRFSGEKAGSPETVAASGSPVQPVEAEESRTAADAPVLAMKDEPTLHTNAPKTELGNTIDYGQRSKARSFGLPTGVAPQLTGTETPLRLEVVCASAADLEWCEDRLRRFIVHRDGVDTIGPVPSEARFRDSDDQEVEREPGQDVEFLVQAPAAELEDLLDLFVSTESVERGITLSHGDAIRARGWSQARQLVDMMRNEATAESIALASTQPADATQDLVPLNNAAVGRDSLGDKVALQRKARPEEARGKVDPKTARPTFDRSDVAAFARRQVMAKQLTGPTITLLIRLSTPASAETTAPPSP